MSFSWWCKDKDGKNLFAEFGINPKAFGLGPARIEYSEARYYLEAIRETWVRFSYADVNEDAARDAVKAVKALVQANIDGLTPQHCDTCKCKLEPKGWILADAKAFMSLPVDRVWRAGGGW